MDHSSIVSLIEDGVSNKHAIWADIGAGTGAFTLALCDILESGTVYAVDKNPHVLWRLESPTAVDIKVVEGDFNQKMDFPEVDGVVIANTLHYSNTPEQTLSNVLAHIKPGGCLILVEYETSFANQWVPYPIRIEQFRSICEGLGLKEVRQLHSVPSSYGHDHIYSAMVMKP